MATVTQIYSMVNDAADEALGSTAITAKDTASLVSLGDVVLSSQNNTAKFYSALVDRIGRTVIAVRKYRTENRSVKRDEMEWGIVYQKISFKKRDAVANPSWADDTQADPFDVEVQTEAIQKLFTKLGTYSFEDSIPDYQLRTAFTSASAMGAYIGGIYTNMDNYLAQAEDDLGNLAVNTLMAGVLIKGTSAQKIDLRTAYNTFSGESLSTVEDCLKSSAFLKFATREIMTKLGNIKKMSTVYNAEEMPRFTPADKAVVEVLGQFASACSTYLESDTYHNELVKLPKYEEVAYWQGSGTSGFAFDDVSKISIENEELATDDNATGEIEQSGIVCLIRDYDACASIIYRHRRSSIYNPRAERVNIFDKADTGYAVDLSENAIVFYISEAEAEEADADALI